MHGLRLQRESLQASENVHPCLPKYTTLETEVEDVANAFTFMQIQPEVDPERCGLLGWGVGGAVCVTVVVVG